MIEEGNEPSPEDIVRQLEKSLGLNPNAAPAWGNEPPDQHLFPDEAPSVEQRQLALDCLSRLFALVEEHKASGSSRPPLQPLELINTAEDFRIESEEYWTGSRPFPDFNLQHLLGATRRLIAWAKELRQFEETEEYNGALQIYRTIRNLLEQVLHDDYPANE